MNEKTARNAWRWVAGHLKVVLSIDVLLLLIVLLAFNGAEGIVLVVKDFLSAVLTSAFAACFISLIFDHIQLDRMIGEANVRSVLDTVFNPEKRVYGVIPGKDLEEFGCIAVAAANGIEPDDPQFGLVETCLGEVSNRLKKPYRSVSINRTYRFNARYPLVMGVEETTVTTYINFSDDTVKGHSEWIKVESLNLPEGAEGPDGVNRLQVETILLDEAGKKANPDYPTGMRELECSVEPEGRIWLNDDARRFNIPGKCSGMRIQTRKLFYISIDDQHSRFAWSEPLKSLVFTAQAVGANVAFAPTVNNCSKCSDEGPCSVCDKGVARINCGDNSAVVEIDDWSGTLTSISIDWNLELENPGEP